MHGRIKIRTTCEENERKKKELLLKVKAYKNVIRQIHLKRSNRDLDYEMMQLTSQLLLKNPDIITLWNIRRENIEKFINSLQNNLNEIYELELVFTEQCLIINPKSYCAWYHRCWILEHSIQPNWNKEIELCNKYLRLDDRNFHTWDYRRYIVEKAKIPRLSEFMFCTNKIKSNFSNYSSWHYRGLLFPKLYPNKHLQYELKLKEELEIVLTAAFTDPNDSSAWFYQHCLLGFSSWGLNISGIRTDNKKMVISFSKPIDINFALIFLNNETTSEKMQLKNWNTLNKKPIDNIWYTSMHSNKLCAHHMYTVNLSIANEQIESIKLTLTEWNKSFYYINPPGLLEPCSSNIRTELQQQLKLCENLLQYEPNSKWTLLTSAIIMQLIDVEQYHKKSLHHLEILQSIDPLRIGYYKDLISKWTFDKILLDWSNSAEIPKTLALMDPLLLSINSFQYIIIADELIISTALEKSLIGKKILPQTFVMIEL